MIKQINENTITAGDKVLWSETALSYPASGHVLDADDYYAEDLDGVTENLFGSGNLNYLVLQAQQPFEPNGEAGDAAFNFGESDLVNSPNGVAHAAGFNAESIGPVRGGFTRSLLDDVANGASQDGAAHNNSGGTTISLASIGGSAAEGDAAVAGNSLESTLNNYFAPPPENPDPNDDGPPNDDPPNNDNGNQEPFLDLDTDLELGDTVDDVLSPVGDIVDGTLDDVGTILTGGLDGLPGNVIDTTTNLVDGTQDLIDATQGIVQDAVDAGTYITENVSLTDPLSNLGNVQDAVSDLLGTNELGLGLDIRDVLEADVGVTFGDELLPDVAITLTPEVLGMGPVTLSTNDILDQTGLSDVIDGVDTVLQDTLQTGPLGDVLGATEGVVGDVAEGLGTQLDDVAAVADDIIDGVQDTLDDVVDGVTEPLEAVADTAEDVLSPVQDVVEDVTDPVIDLVENTAGDAVGGILDDLGLMGEGDETDTDLGLDVGLGAGDLDLGLAENIILDPVENIIGDVDINLIADADSDGINDLDLTVDGDLFDQVGNLLGLEGAPYEGDNDGGTGGNEGGGLLGGGDLGEQLADAGDTVGGILGGLTETLEETLTDVPEDLATAGEDVHEVVSDLLSFDNTDDTDLTLDVDVETTLDDVGLGGLEVGGLDVGDVGVVVDAAGEVILDPVEQLVGDIDIDVDLDINPSEEDLGLGVDTDIDLVEDVQNLAGDVLDPLEEPLEHLVDGVDTTVEHITDGVNHLLNHGHDDGADTDLTVDVGVEAGDIALEIADELVLDPVEALIGDVDIDVNLDLSEGGLGDVGLNADTELLGDLDLLGSPETEDIISQLDDTLHDTAGTALDLLDEATAGTEEAIGDLLPCDGPALDGLLSGGSVLDVLPDPGGSADEGLAGLFNHQDDGGGFAGLF